MGDFKAKNLTYDHNEPAFLRRMRGAVTGSDSDRHEQPVARPKRLKKDGEDEDDAPTYVVEDSNETLSKTEYEELMKKGKTEDDRPSKADGNEGQSSATAPTDGAPTPSKQNITEIGHIQKKRKAAKVIGDTEEEPENHVRTTKAATGKPKKKTKVVKLSFGDDEPS
ncbi:hypothetical protein LTS18_003610 [Coniosporium uncinatum]|uniref:Uncharacterized protein n=1 Tax=Coniosporium uncinatum TaxID=93489 RepID=A0ACC3DTH0_9PEZI|nr:hypothetical protein LTS18_003610 [Coniosporium uncinatum]